MKESPKTAIVMGKDRSGTSLTAGILHHLGVNMGDKMKGVSPNNPKGHFENWNILEFNIFEILENHGFDINDYPLPSLEEVADLKDEIGDLAGELIAREKKDTIWGFKDPRNLWTFQLYSPYIDNPYFLVNYRRPYCIIKSMEDGWGWKGREKARKIIRQYYELVEEFFEKYDHPRLNIQYEDYFEDGEKQVKRICEFLKIPFKEKAVEHIDPTIRHC